MSDKGITLEGLAAAVDALRQELATWKALAHKQDQLSADQITATQSGATAAKISQIAVNTAAIQALAAQVAGQIALEYVATLPATGEPLTLYLVPQGDGTAPNYCDEYLWINDAWELIGTTGAMANNGELTIQVNGAAVGTFTANQAANAAVNITVPTNTNQLVNGAGYVDTAALQAALLLKQNSLNPAQLAAVNSGITAAGVQQISTNTDAIATKAADNAVVHLAGAETISGDKTFTGAVDTHNITPETDGLYALGTTNLRWQRINTGSIYNWGSYIFNTGITAAAQGAQSTALNYNILNAITSDSSPLSFGLQSLSLSNTLTQYSLNLRLFDSNGALVTSESLLYRLTSSGLSVYPLTSGQDGLGTSTNKWKTLNGINPGMLSFPANSYVAIDTTGWTAGGANQVQINGADPTYPGWLFVRLSNIDPATDYCLIRLFGGGNGDMSVYGAHSDKHIMVIAPVPANTAVRVYCSVLPAYCRYYVCQGNV